ncbi:GTPase ObgE [bacterium]|nr:GTPase ObgE [bacterium]
MKFLDEVIVTVSSGKGGAGVTSFRREKYVPEGGPDGGDGGDGGAVRFIGSNSYNTLYHLRQNRYYRATDGTAGKGQKKAGKKGDDVILYVPCGTIIKDAETDEILADITEHEQEITLLKGGKGGLGNWHFRNSINQVPHYSQPGLSGETLKIKLELKSIADVGIIGFPNAGKSTFISVVSNATPEIADYPFTTLIPHLGVVSIDYYNNFVVADIPGIIEGAHEGAGLGLEFLKHIERTKLLLHLVAYNSENGVDYLLNQYKTIRNELLKFSEDLKNKKEIIAISKIDLIDNDSIFEDIKSVFSEVTDEIYFISAPLHEGVKQLVLRLFQEIESIKNNQN